MTVDSSVTPVRPSGSDTRDRPGRMQPEDLLIGVALGALFLVIWPVVNVLRAGVPLQSLVLTAHIAGLLAGYGVVILVGLMSRAPFLERGIGADTLARWHSHGGRAVVTLVVVHAWAAVAAWAGVRSESLWLAWWHVTLMPFLMAATLGTAMFLAVAVLSVRAARKRVSFETWHAIHLMVYVGVALSFLHQLAGPDLVGHRVIQVLWALMYTYVFALVARYRVITPLQMAGRHRMRVAAVVPEGPGVVSIVVEGHHLDELEAESGQFFRWRFLTPDLWLTAHPFSLSAAPTGTQLRLTVKTLGDGSAKLQHLEPGTWVLAEGPYGAMTAERRTRRKVLLMAGGVGITPLRALFETLEVGRDQDVLLLYRARNEDELLFRDELEQIAADRGARLHYWLGDDIGPLTPQLLVSTVPDLVQRDVYMCGPPGLTAALRKAMLGAGLPVSQLHEERFTF
jgi:predicted ferric reductase